MSAPYIPIEETEPDSTPEPDIDDCDDEESFDDWLLKNIINI